MSSHKRKIKRRKKAYQSNDFQIMKALSLLDAQIVTCKGAFKGDDKVSPAQSMVALWLVALDMSNSIRLKRPLSGKHILINRLLSHAYRVFNSYRGHLPKADAPSVVIDGHLPEQDAARDPNLQAVTSIAIEFTVALHHMTHEATPDAERRKFLDNFTSYRPFGEAEGDGPVYQPDTHKRDP